MSAKRAPTSTPAAESADQPAGGPAKRAKPVTRSESAKRAKPAAHAKPAKPAKRAKQAAPPAAAAPAGAAASHGSPQDELNIPQVHSFMEQVSEESRVLFILANLRRMELERQGTIALRDFLMTQMVMKRVSGVPLTDDEMRRLLQQDARMHRTGLAIIRQRAIILRYLRSPV